MLRKMNDFSMKLYHRLHIIVRNSALAYNVLFYLIMAPIWVLCYLSGEETRKRIDLMASHYGLRPSIAYCYYLNPHTSAMRVESSLRKLSRIIAISLLVMN